MTCTVPVCAPITPPQIGGRSITATTANVTSCDGCELTVLAPSNTTRQAIRTITMGQDPCVTPAPAVTVIYEATKSVQISQAFLKNNCTTGTGSSVVYVGYGDSTAYSIISQADADAKAHQAALVAAQDDVVGNGQANANASGVCA